ncbi:MAG: cyclic nucleotide-binding domain-containing protein [Pseudomonadota bacterium]
MNLIAASCVAVSLIEAFNLSSLVIQAIWIAISLIGLARIFHFRNLHRFSLDDRKFGDAVLPELEDAELRALVKVGTWETLPAGTELTREGVPIEALIYLSSGAAEVERGGKVVAQMNNARFIGEVTCMTGDDATATVRLTRDARVLRLPSAEFRSFIMRRRVVRDHLEKAFARDLRRKLSERIRERLVPEPAAAPA